MFSTLYGTFFHFKYTLKCRLQSVSVWTRLKICCLVKSQLFIKQQSLRTVWTPKFKAFADNKLYKTEISKFVLGDKKKKKKKKNVGKEENAGYQQFLPFLTMFSEGFSRGSLTLSQTTNFGIFQTERVCRRQVLI